jgi:F-type H+-transporting ATPase subunit delta
VARARAVLEKLTARRVFLTCVVEPSLLGGAVTRIGSTVYDGSLSTQLGALRRRMAEE